MRKVTGLESRKGFIMLAMGIEDLHGFMRDHFPQVLEDLRIESFDEQMMVTRLLTADRHLRPGGTISGPAMFMLADVSMYLAILGHIGGNGMTATTNCSIDFMRMPKAGADLLAEVRIHKMGRTLAMGDVFMRSEGSDAIVARASLTYSMPPLR